MRETSGALDMQSDTGPQSGQSSTGGEGKQSVEHLYAQSLGSEDQFNRRNGVFYPSGYALLALPDAEKVGTGSAVAYARRRGRERHHPLASRSDAAVDGRLPARRRPLARIVSAELKQMTVLRQLADAGNHFVLVKNSEDIDKLLQSVSVKAGVSKGLLFHSLAVEELRVDKEVIQAPVPTASMRCLGP
jgi:hypothetical protein